MAVSVLLIQLPLQEPDSLSTRANVPLAAGYLAAYAETRLGSRLKIDIAPREIVNDGGDGGILRWVESGGWEVVGFTLYLWNRERSLKLASELKRRNPRLVIVAGGPETAEAADPRTRESFPGPDAVVVGEGEAAFVSLLRDYLEEGRVKPLYSEAPLPSLEAVPSPYLTGTLPIRPEDPVYLETMRGCPCRCSYCFYGKSTGGIRSFPKRLVKEVFEKARLSGAGEIYLMDPSFNAAGNLDGRLRGLAALNRPALPLHTELRLEAVTETRADLLKEAGFVSVEVGLQSVRPEVLKTVNRPFDRGRFVRGAELLAKTGIEIRTGVILGLPGDGLSSFLETLGFVTELGLAPGLEIYPLAVLPGTELRGRAEALGLSHMTRPPYWILETPALPQEEMFEALARAEDLLGIEYFRPIPPRFEALRNGWLSFVDLGKPSAFGLLEDAAERIASDLTLLIPGRFLRRGGEVSRLIELGRTLLNKNPFTVYKLVVEEDEGPLPRAAEEIQEAFFNPGHPVNRSRYFQIDSQQRFSARLFQLTGNLRLAERLKRPVPSGDISQDAAKTGGGPPADLVLRYGGGMAETGGADLKKLLRGHPFVLLPAEGCSKGELADIRRFYRKHPALVLEIS